MRLIIYREKTSSWSDNYGSGHVSILALADSDETPYITKSSKEPVYRAIFSYSPYAEKPIKVLHFQSKEGTEKNWGDEEDLAFDNLVTFKSNVSLHQFLRGLGEAGYDTNAHYHPVKNNCVHAVLKALSIAKIDFNINKAIGCKHLILFFWCPTTIVTPKDLMRQLKAYKKESIKENTQQELSQQIPGIKTLKMD